MHNKEIQKYIDYFEKNKVYGQLIFCFENGNLVAVKKHQTFKPKKNKKKLDKVEKSNI